MIWQNKKSSNKNGIFIRFEREVDPEVRGALMRFVKWLRANYEFPIKLNVYVKSKPRITARDGERVCGIFFRPDNYGDIPYIKLATGDYAELASESGRDDALASIIWTFAHELTHYYQYASKAKLTLRGEEIQASHYAIKILRLYAETTKHP